MNTFNEEFLNKYIDEYLKIFPFSGMIRVTQKDKILFERNVGWANFEKKIPFTNRAMFSLYSLSKPFCAIGLMKLYDKGMVDIDAHPSTYLPEMQGFHKDLTIRDMLHHISGLPDFIQTESYRETYKNVDVSLREELKLIQSVSVGIPPETKSHYANVNFTVCALIIETISKLPYGEYMKREVFDPLGMKTAIVDEKGLHLENRVQGYEIVNGERVPVERAIRWMKGGGDIVGTIEDVYRLNIAVKYKLLLTESSWKTILSTFKLNHFGMGCTVRNWHGKKLIQHNGGFTGFRTLHRHLIEDDFDIILLINYRTIDLRDAMSEAIYAARYGLDKEEILHIKMDAGYIQEETPKMQEQRLLYEIYKAAEKS